MNTLEKAIKKVLAAKARKGEDYPTITNEQLVGVVPKNNIEELGVDSQASIMRMQMKDVLETGNGVSLIPLDYRGTFQVVPIDEAAIFNTRKRLNKMVTSVENAEHMVLDYQTNPQVSDEVVSLLNSCKKVIDFNMSFLEEALTPKLERLNRMLDKQMQLMTGTD